MYGYSKLSLPRCVLWEKASNTVAYIIKTDQMHPDQNAVQFGANIIRNNGLVVFPTETVYGLGANALSESACRKIYLTKERPADNPLIVHVSSLDMLHKITVDIDPDVEGKLGEIWPGPVTLLFQKSEQIPDLVTASSPRVAVRMPDNPLALQLIEKSGVPIAAPSANISTRASITDSKYAIDELKDRVDLIYDSGPTKFGLESTILDLSGDTPVLLRAGSKTVEDLERIFGKIYISEVARGMEESPVAITPGMKYKHYSPVKTLILVDVSTFEEISMNRNLKGEVLMIGSTEECKKSLLDYFDLGSQEDLRTVAAKLFIAFRELDKRSEKIGVIHPFPEYGYGLAIMNRIRKASSYHADTIKEFENKISGI